MKSFEGFGLKKMSLRVFDIFPLRIKSVANVMTGLQACINHFKTVSLLKALVAVNN